MMTRSTVSSVRWVTATEDAYSIQASLGPRPLSQPRLTTTTESSATATKGSRLSPLERYSSILSAKPLTYASCRMVSAKYLTGLFQCQCPFEVPPARIAASHFPPAPRPFFRRSGISEQRGQIPEVRQSGCRSHLPGGTEQGR